MSYKGLIFCLLIIIVICVIFSLHTFYKVSKRSYKPANNLNKMYLNTQGNGTTMVIGGFSSPNHLYGMNMVPYSGPL